MTWAASHEKGFDYWLEDFKCRVCVKVQCASGGVREVATQDPRQPSTEPGELHVERPSDLP